ncbi:MAG: efflux RND transporter periplasmic adaptor subunit [Planctomycetaceae bacterium]|nr:efflux RND transporter periplasmic adaptor subunit [Planctomycetaceae bacterium]
MPAKLRIIVVLLLVALSAAALWQFGPWHETSDRQIRLSGNIETTEVQIAFKIPGRVVERRFDEGQRVHRNDVVAVLDTADLQCNVDLRKAELQGAEVALAELRAGSRQEEKDAARAAMDRAAHALADLEAGSRPQEVVVAQAGVAAAAAEMTRRNSDLERSTALFQRKSISAEEYDAAKAAADVAIEKHRQAVEQLKLAEEGFRKERIEEARGAFRQAKAQWELVMAGPRREEIERAEARVAQAKAALRLAETQLSYATVRSPIDGIVLSKNIEPGEYVAPGTAVVTIGDLENVWLRGYVDGVDLGRVKPDRRAWVTTDTKPGKRYEGRVSFIAEEAEFTPKNVQTQKERVKLMYRIKIDLYNPDFDLKPGMPADAVIETGVENEGRAAKKNETDSSHSSSLVPRPQP